MVAVLIIHLNPLPLSTQSYQRKTFKSPCSLCSLWLNFFQCFQQRIGLLGLADADADAVTQAGLVEVADENAVFFGQAGFELRGVAAADLAQDEVGMRRVGTQVRNLIQAVHQATAFGTQT